MSTIGQVDRLEVLFQPLIEGALAFPAEGEGAFLGARAGNWLASPFAGRIVCEQDFRPFHDELAAAGARLAPASGPAGVPDPLAGRFPLVLALLPRQRQQSRAVLARAVMMAGQGGRVLAVQANNEGARSAQADLEALAGPVQVITRNKCRAFWTGSLAGGGSGPGAAWMREGSLQTVIGGDWWSRPGVFSWDRIDPGSALLAECLPPRLAGHAADLGAGWGWLSAQLLERCPGIARLDLYEADAGALEPAHRNLGQVLGQAGRDVPIHLHWHDVSRGIAGRFDVIVSNPPFHQGRAGEPTLGQDFIRSAAAALETGGSFWMVANRHLPYEATLAHCFAEVSLLATAGGYKVFRAVRPKRPGARA